VETYLLSALSPHNVKVRGNALEVKRREAVDPLGLECWRPTLRATFPLAGGALAELWDAWGIPAPSPLRTTYGFGEFVREIVAPDPALRRVDVIKRRTRLVVDGCPGEHVTLLVRDAHWESLAFEHEDPALVIGVLRRLGLDPAANTSYPAAFKRIVGLPTLPPVPSAGVA
jgi:exopolyphosphatase/guanosine-5'-triphosphate,3'-diphosphate pyrophosphatase